VVLILISVSFYSVSRAFFIFIASGSHKKRQKPLGVYTEEELLGQYSEVSPVLILLLKKAFSFSVLSLSQKKTFIVL